MKLSYDWLQNNLRMQGKHYHQILYTFFCRNDACRMSGQTRRFKDSRFTGDEDEEEIDGCVAGTAGKYVLDKVIL